MTTLERALVLRIASVQAGVAIWFNGVWILSVWRFESVVLWLRDQGGYKWLVQATGLPVGVVKVGVVALWFLTTLCVASLIPLLMLRYRVGAGGRANKPTRSKIHHVPREP